MNREPILFSGFMEQALYGKNGYYMTDRPRFGRSGDFYTSVQVSSLYGALWGHVALIDCVDDDRVRIVELGCGDGGLAAAMLPAMLSSPRLQGRKIEYAGVDLSPVALQRAAHRIGSALEGRAGRGTVSTVFARTPADLIESTGDGFVGAWVFGNEVLDALPCDVVRVDRSGLWRLWVARSQEIPSGALPGALGRGSRRSYFLAEDRDQTWWREVWTHWAPLLDEFAVDELVGEWSFGMSGWLREMLTALRPCTVAFVDYGGFLRDVVGPDRPCGSVRGYRRHELVDDILDVAPDCDITYDVNFEPVQRLLREHGLRTSALQRQGAFLLALPDVLTVLQGFEQQLPGGVRAASSLFMPGGGLGDRFVVCKAER